MPTDPITTVVTDIEKEMESNFTTIPLEGPNAPVQQRTSAFARMFILPGDYVTGADAVYNRRVGQVTIMIFVPKGTGTRDAWAYARAAAGVLEKKSIGSSAVRFLTATILNIGTVGEQLQQDESWYRLDVTIPFFYEWFDT